MINKYTWKRKKKTIIKKTLKMRLFSSLISQIERLAYSTDTDGYNMMGYRYEGQIVIIHTPEVGEFGNNGHDGLQDRLANLYLSKDNSVMIEYPSGHVSKYGPGYNYTLANP